MNCNGCIVQEVNDKNNIVETFNYLGIKAYHSYPLMWVNDSESRALTKEQFSKEVSKDCYQILEFISNEDLLNRYVNACVQRDIDVRTLLIESEYDEELWRGCTPNIEFLGYEYCSIPFDEQIITDFDLYAPLSGFKNDLNKYGLFDSYEKAEEFRYLYDWYWANGYIGDGTMNTYIFKVSEVKW